MFGLTNLRRAYLAALAVAALALPAPAAGQPRLLFFGDSFLDTGNFFGLIDTFTPNDAGFPPAPYYAGRFSSGPVWAEPFAALLGRPGDAVASSAGGQNYAYGGATTGHVNVTFNDPRLRGQVDMLRAGAGLPPIDWAAYSATGYGLLDQVQGFATANPTGNGGALAVLFGGGNDFVNNLGPNPVQTVIGAAQNMIAAAATLRAVGVTEFLVPVLPDLALTPRARLLPPAQAAGLSGLVDLYNTLLRTGFTQFAANTGSTYYGLSLDVLFDNIVRYPSVYGFTNTSVPCLLNFGTPAQIPCDVSVFADEFHPTGRGHEVVAQAAYARVAFGVDVAAIPEPSTVVLLAGGLVLLAGVARRKLQR